MTDPNVPAENRPSISLPHYWHILLKWKWTAISFLLLVVGGVTVYMLLTPHIYTSTGTIWVEEQMKVLPFEDVQSPDESSASPQSYSQLLQSRALALKVIEKLKLYENEHFAGKPRRGEKLPPPTDRVYMELLLQKFRDSVSVSPIERTKLLDVSFSDSDPKFASDTLNTLFDEYIDMIIKQRYAASQQATQFLKSQITLVRSEIDEDEKKLSAYGSSRNILPLTAAETPTVTRLSEVNKALTDATIDRVNKFDTYNQLKSGNLAEMPQTPNGSPVQKLQDQYATLSQEYAKRLGTLRPEYPEMQRLKSQIDSVKSSLDSESKKMVDTAFADYQVALNKERSLQGLLEQSRTDAFRANDSSVVYNSLRIELENKKALLEALAKRQSETDLSSRLKTLEAGNIWVVDRADLPLKPTTPNKKKTVLMGLIAALAGAIGLAFGLEYLNNTVRTSRDVMAATGLTIIGSIPSFEAEMNPKGPLSEFRRIAAILSGKGESRRGRPARDGGGGKADRDRAVKSGLKEGTLSSDHIELIASREPQSIQAESYRSIRTTLLVSSPPGKFKAILITSPLAREGKSVTVANLGITLSQANKRVVIIDADLRKPKQSRIFGLNGGWGLSHFVTSFIEEADLVRPTEFPNLSLIGSGPLPANPIELLTADRMDHLIAFLKRSFDYVLIDSPPVLAVSDALALGPMIDGVILVTRGGQTPIPALKQAKQKIDAHKLKCLGVIINGINLVEQDGYYAKQYYQYSKPE